MSKNKNEVRAFINYYLWNETSASEIKALGFIEYHRFYKTKIDRDHDKILNFFCSNFDLSSTLISYSKLLYDKDNKRWLEIEDAFDIELLDLLLALGIASSVFLEDLSIRCKNFVILGGDSFVLNEDSQNVQACDFNLYLQIMRDKVIPLSEVCVNPETLKFAKENSDTIKDDLSADDKKALLLSWWEDGMPDNNEYSITKEIFKGFLDGETMSDLILLVYRLYSHKLSSATLSKMIEGGNIYSQLLSIKAIHERLSSEGKKAMECNIREMFEELSKFKQKKKRLN